MIALIEFFSWLKKRIGIVSILDDWCNIEPFPTRNEPKSPRFSKKQVDHREVMLTMNEIKLRTIEQLEAFLKATAEIEFTGIAGDGIDE